MKLQKTLAVSFVTAMALAGGASAAQADAGDGKFDNNVNKLVNLECTNVEVITLDVPIIGNANNQDCSKNFTAKKRIDVDVDH